MHILYFHQYFALPTGSTGTRSYEMARRWVAAGHRVTMICGRAEACGLPNRTRFEAAGIQVRIVNSVYSQKHSFSRRIWAFIFFLTAGMLEGLRVKNIDVVYASSTPLTIGIPALLLKWLRRRPFVFEVRDQWPEVPISMGYIRSPLLKKSLLWLERLIYKESSAVVALSPGMAEGVRQALGRIEKPILVAPNSADTQLFRPDIDGASVRIKMGWEDKLVVMHFGAMGTVNTLDFLVDIAEKIRHITNIHIVCIGEGKERHRLSERVNSLRLSNIEIHGPVEKERLPEMVAACDISTVIIGNYPIIEHNSANKFFDSLAAGKPILLNYSGWQREYLEKFNCGYGCQLCEQGEYIQKLMDLCTQPEKRKLLGQNARKLAEEIFNRDKIAASVLDLLERTVGVDRP